MARVDRRIGGYPFDAHSGVESLTWRAGLDRWLADVAAAVHADVPFHRALIGFEIDEDRDITVDQRYAAVLVSRADGFDYRRMGFRAGLRSGGQGQRGRVGGRLRYLAC